MIIYNYNQLGEFTHSSESEFLPNMATSTPPPEPMENCAVLFIRDQWRQIPKHIPTPEEVQAEQAQEALRLREERKQQRQQDVDAITVTVNGKVFDGDEVSQTRMSRAILGMQVAGATSINWTLADNSVAQATLEELAEALVLAGQRQAELWIQN